MSVGPRALITLAPVRDLEWRWADPRGQQRLVREDELRAGLSNGAIPPNAPVWRPGWKAWQSAYDVPELSSSALAAANGLIPNIPPPPMFMLEAQNSFEGKTREAPIGGEEPPPPPRYEPAEPPARVMPKVEIKRTIPGPAPPPSNADISIIIPPAAATPDRTVANSKAPGPPLAETRPSKPPIAGPTRSSKFPAATPGGATKTGTVKMTAVKSAVKGAPPAPDLSSKDIRSTLIFGDGNSQAPAAGKEAITPNAQPIVVPAPTDARPAEKNAITRPPPWGEGAARMGNPDADDTIPSSDLFEADDLADEPESRRSGRPAAATGRSSIPPPLPPKKTSSTGSMGAVRSVPPGPGGAGRSLPPPLPGKRSTMIASPTPAPASTSPKPAATAGEVSGTLIGHSAERIAGDKRGFGPPSDGKTLVGMPRIESQSSDTLENDVPAELLAKEKTGEEGADGARPTTPPTRKSFTSLVRTDELPILKLSFRQRIDQFVDRVPFLRALREKQPTLVMPLLAVTAGLVALLFIVGMANIISPSKDAASSSASGDTKPSATPSSTSAIPSNVATATAPSATVAPVEPPRTSSSTIPCTLNGDASKTGARGLVALGVEVAEHGGTFAIGFAPSEKEGQALRFTDALAPKYPVDRKRSPSAVRRVIPFLGDGGKVKAFVDADGSSIVGRRTASFGGYDFGMKDGQVVAIKKSNEATTALFALDGEGPIEALRVAPSGDGWALAFRRQGKVYFARVKGGDGPPTPDGALLSREPVGTQVGSPSIAVSGDTLLLAWAELIDGTWTLRLHRTGPQGEATTNFAAPEGGPGAPFLSPSVAGLGDGRFLLLWTEGKGESHAVRGVTLSDRGAILGSPLTLSAPDINAGQGQAVVDANGHGFVAFLAGTGKMLDIMVAGVSCPGK